jgi:hypothetical protein
MRPPNQGQEKGVHAILCTLLETLIAAQKSGLLDNIPLTLANEQKLVNLKIAVIFIIGDMQGGNKMRCNAAAYSNPMNPLCHKCNIKGKDAGDPFVQCKRMSMNKIIQLVKDNKVAALHSINQYNVHSAWFDVGYDGCQYGIFRAACPLMLYMHLQMVY